MTRDEWELGHATVDAWEPGHTVDCNSKSPHIPSPLPLSLPLIKANNTSPHSDCSAGSLGPWNKPHNQDKWPKALNLPSSSRPRSAPRAAGSSGIAGRARLCLRSRRCCWRLRERKWEGRRTRRRGTLHLHLRFAAAAVAVAHRKQAQRSQMGKR